MGTPRTYLDHNATTPIRDEARLAVIGAMDLIGNPSSVHAEGREAFSIVENARTSVAKYLGADPREIVFTSGATESNNWVIRQPWAAVLTSATEHDSILSPAHEVACPTHIIPVNSNGVIDLESLEATLATLLERVEPGDENVVPTQQPDTKKVLVSIQAANAETGVIQPLAKIRRVLVDYPGALLHVDAVQLRPCHRNLFEAAQADFASLSAHKMGGPKGVGALFAKAGLSLAPMIFGGGQELRRRSGTQNVAGIAGFGAAALAASSPQEQESAKALQILRDDIERCVEAITPQVIYVGDETDRLCNTACICVPGIRAETLVMALDIAGVAVSAGSACSSGKVTESHVLRAMGFSKLDAASAVRVSLGWSSTKDDVTRFLEAWWSVMQRLAAGLNRPDTSTTTTTTRQLA